MNKHDTLCMAPGTHTYLNTHPEIARAMGYE